MNASAGGTYEHVSNMASVDNDRGFLSPVHEWRPPLMVPHVNIMTLCNEALHPAQVTTPNHREQAIHTLDTNLINPSRH